MHREETIGPVDNLMYPDVFLLAFIVLMAQLMLIFCVKLLLILRYNNCKFLISVIVILA